MRTFTEHPTRVKVDREFQIRNSKFLIPVFLAISAAALPPQNDTAAMRDAMPAKVTKHGLMVEIRDVVRLPDTRKLRPVDQDVVPAGWARINFVRDLPDGRRFVNDSRG